MSQHLGWQSMDNTSRIRKTDNDRSSNQAKSIGGQFGQAVSTMLVVHKAVTTEQTATTKPMTSFGLVTCSWKPIGSPLSSNGAIGSRPGVLQWILFITLSNHGGHNTTNENNTYEFRKQISTKSIKNSKRYAVTDWTHVIHTLTYYTILP